MKFEFERFANILRGIYPESPYTVEETLEVFRYFFGRYEEFTGEAHPAIKASQVIRICKIMPFLDGQPGPISDIEPETYPEIIEQYFQTPFRNCNYRINHFFSGRIRELRLYESSYMCGAMYYEK